jgi:hypothetical protein
MRIVKQLMSGILGLGLFLTLSIYAFASVTLDFTFGPQTIGSTNIAGLSGGATVSEIQTYMDDVLSAAGCTGCSVIVATGTASGAGASNDGYQEGAVTDTNYDAGDVVGPVIGGTVVPTTLGDTNNATSNSSGAPTSINPTYHTFLASPSGPSQITLQFSGLTNETLTVNSFAYEIFRAPLAARVHRG